MPRLAKGSRVQVARTMGSRNFAEGGQVTRIECPATSQKDVTKHAG
jgi:hypothetical protein